MLTVIITSCSSDDDGDEMVTPTPQETFGNWSPDFTNQTENFNQTRSGSNGTQETRSITITSSSTNSTDSEKNLNLDVNNDGDKLDEVNVEIITYTASNGLGSHQLIVYEMNNDINNYFKIESEKPINKSDKVDLMRLSI